MYNWIQGSISFMGGQGKDTVKLAGKLADYQLKQVFTKMTVTALSDATHVTTMVNVENIQFADQSLSLRYDSQINAVAGIYTQIFARQADIDGVHFWIDATTNKGLSLGKMALYFIGSEELTHKNGFAIQDVNISTQVEQFYQRLLGRTADGVGKAFWIEKLSEGSLSLEELASNIISSPEMQTHYAPPEQWDFYV